MSQATLMDSATPSLQSKNTADTLQPSPFNSPSRSKRQGRKSPKKKKNQKSTPKETTEPNSSQATPTKNGNKRGVKQDTPEHTNEADRHAKKLVEKKAGNIDMDTNAMDTFGPPQVERLPNQPPATTTPGYTGWKQQIENQDKPTDQPNNQVSPDQVQVTWSTASPLKDSPQDANTKEDPQQQAILLDMSEDEEIESQEGDLKPVAETPNLKQPPAKPVSDTPALPKDPPATPPGSPNNRGTGSTETTGDQEEMETSELEMSED
jgi:hypothetical protein